jgi:hypothetical protein
MIRPASPGRTPTSSSAPWRPPTRGFVPLDPVRVAEQAERHIFGYQLLVRRAVTELVGDELGLGWAAPAADGSCEVTGLPARALQVVESPCRPLGEIAACWDSRERR